MSPDGLLAVTAYRAVYERARGLEGATEASAHAAAVRGAVAALRAAHGGLFLPRLAARCEAARKALVPDPQGVWDWDGLVRAALGAESTGGTKKGAV